MDEIDIVVLLHHHQHCVISRICRGTPPRRSKNAQPPHKADLEKICNGEHRVFPRGIVAQKDGESMSSLRAFATKTDLPADSRRTNYEIRYIST